MSYPADYADELVRNAKTMGQSELNRLLVSLQKNIETPEDDTITNDLVYSPHIDRHTLISQIFSGLDLMKTLTLKSLNYKSYQKRISLPVHTDPLIYDFSNASGLTFASPYSGIGARFGGGAISDGSSLIKINSHPSLEITDELTIALWVYLKPSTLTSDEVIIEKNLDEDFILYFNFSTSTITILYRMGGTLRAFNINVIVDGWYHVVITLKSGEQHFYLNGALEISSSNTGILSISNTDIGIMATTFNTNHLKTGQAISWLSVIHGFVGPTWAANDFLGLRDLTGLDELICLPFVQSLSPQPSATAGICLASP